MTETVRGKLILTTDLERTLAAKLAVANRYGVDRDREIEQLEARLAKAEARPGCTVIGYAIADSVPSADGQTHTVRIAAAPDPDPIIYRIHRSDLAEQPLPWLVGQLVDAYAEHRRNRLVPASRATLDHCLARLLWTR